jgi:hypothetical protein
MVLGGLIQTSSGNPRDARRIRFVKMDLSITNVPGAPGCGQRPWTWKLRGVRDT